MFIFIRFAATLRGYPSRLPFAATLRGYAASQLRFAATLRGYASRLPFAATLRGYAASQLRYLRRHEVPFAATLLRSYAYLRRHEVPEQFYLRRRVRRDARRKSNDFPKERLPERRD
jgi:hypothetical protein